MAKHCLVLALTLITACASDESGPSDRALMLLQDSRYSWTTIETASARVHYAEGSFAERERDALAGRVESAMAAIRERLSVPDYPETVDVFYVDAREDMQRLTGSPVTGFAFTESQAVALVFNERWRAFERHELTHVISLNVWGEPGEPSAATLEGFATFVDGDCGGYEIGRVVRTLLAKDLLLDWEPLLGAFRAQDDLIAYLQAASLVEYVATQGAETSLRSLWGRGLAAAAELLGVSWSEFEDLWLEWLRASYAPIPEQAWGRIRSDGCGIQAGPAADRPGPPRGRIAFYSQRDGNSEIYVIDLDGNGLGRLTRNEADDVCPAWSPDGTMLAFVSDRDGNDEIYVMRANGSGQRRLTDTPGSEFHPDWSPDGTLIAFRAERDGNIDIYVMRVDGTDERRLTFDPGVDHRPHWSPDGQRILFGSNRDGNFEVYVMDGDGGNQQRLTESRVWEIFPRYSPNGEFIAFASGYVDGPQADVHIMRADGTGERALTSFVGREEDVVWSPQGDYLAFQAEHEGNFEIYIMAADGTGLRRLTRSGAGNFWPSWAR